jgi:hypothetical protein
MGLIKILIIGVNATLIFVLPWPSEPDGLLTSPVLPFVVMTGLIPGYYLLVRKEKKERLKWPTWNTNLFNPKANTALGNIDFFRILFVIIGLAMFISNKMNYDEGRVGASHFIESHPEYKWLDTIAVKGVIIGDWLLEKQRRRHFKDLSGRINCKY